METVKDVSHFLNELNFRAKVFEDQNDFFKKMNES